MRTASPLRYPGGKWRVASFIDRVISLNDLHEFEYVEPYAGGASLALSLLLRGSVSRIHLNDLDPAIFSFWWSVLKRPRALIRFIGQVPLTIGEWRRQRSIYARGTSAGRLALGCATFYLNRTNHSGIMNGGVIGGKAQRGPWRIDARFNRRELQRRVGLIAEQKSRIRIYCQDALVFLARRPFSSESLIYLDPPYFRPGMALYLNAYNPDDHARVQSAVRRLRGPWIVSYDDVPPVRLLYRSFRSRRVTLLHTARSTHHGKERMFFSHDLRIPKHPSQKPCLREASRETIPPMHKP
jgi:DNA adenine methylase